MSKTALSVKGESSDHNDRETWSEDADEFKPERWLGNLPSSVSDAKTSGVYSSM